MTPHPVSHRELSLLKQMSRSVSKYAFSCSGSSGMTSLVLPEDVRRRSDCSPGSHQSSRRSRSARRGCRDLARSTGRGGPVIASAYARFSRSIAIKLPTPGVWDLNGTQTDWVGERPKGKEGQFKKTKAHRLDELPHSLEPSLLQTRRRRTGNSFTDRATQRPPAV